jgi:hypothetical protein
MSSRPAHGGYPGEVVVRLPATDPMGFLPLGDLWVEVGTLRSWPVGALAAISGATEEEVLEARGWTDVRYRTRGVQDPGDLPL